MPRATLIAAVAVTVATFAAGAPAQVRVNTTADTLAACRATLIGATYDSEKVRLDDWRMAEHVDEPSYAAIKQAFGPDAALYGVPAGLAYSDFQDSLAQLKQAGEPSFTSREFLNVAWTGLDGLPDGPYQACLEATAGLDATGGIMLAPTAATQADVGLMVRYRPGPGDPDPLPVEWIGVDESSRPPPPALTAGDQAVILPRPARERTVSVTGGGFTASIVLTPLPEMRHGDAALCAITATPTPIPALRQFDVATWVCPDLMPAGTYRVSADIPAGTDRADGAFRVSYRLALLVPFGGKTFAVDLPATGGGFADLAASADFPAAFRTADQFVSIPGGVVSFVLQVTGIADRSDLSDGTADDATVVPASGVRLTLERMPD